MLVNRRLIYRIAQLYWRIFRPLTLGSRVLVVKDGQVLLVKLTYAMGWCLPGGGVDRNESFRDGAARELLEECGIEARSLELLGLYYTTKYGKRDHVAIYVVTDFAQATERARDPEIADMRFFPLDTLPPNATPSTRRRVQDFLAGKQNSVEW